ncbi:MAG: tetratricopeptide repeat protein, partial [Chlamydiales bacterium]|nr:tetratricopeptide repeat protein [Chlamydiales bacterium]
AIAAIAYRAIPHIANFIDSQAKRYNDERVRQAASIDFERSSLAERSYNEGVDQLNSGNAESAVEKFKEAWSIYASLYGESNRYVADCCFNIGSALYALNRMNEALLHFQKALDISALLNGEPNPYGAECQCFIAKVQLCLGNDTTALKSSESGLSVFKNLHEDRHNRLKAALHSLIGCIQLKLKNSQQALEHSNIALQFCENSIPPEAIILYDPLRILVLHTLIIKEHAMRQIDAKQSTFLAFKQGLEPFRTLFEAEGVNASEISLKATNTLKQYGLSIASLQLELAINSLTAPRNPA